MCATFITKPITPNNTTNLFAAVKTRMRIEAGVIVRVVEVIVRVIEVEVIVIVIEVVVIVVEVVVAIVEVVVVIVEVIVVIVIEVVVIEVKCEITLRSKRKTPERVARLPCLVQNSPSTCETALRQTPPAD